MSSSLCGSLEKKDLPQSISAPKQNKHSQPEGLLTLGLAVEIVLLIPSANAFADVQGAAIGAAFFPNAVFSQAKISPL